MIKTNKTINPKSKKFLDVEIDRDRNVSLYEKDWTVHTRNKETPISKVIKTVKYVDNMLKEVSKIFWIRDPKSMM